VTEQYSESCEGAPGKVAPVVDRNRCEGKEDCIRVCPCSVFEIGTLSKAEKSGLSLVGRVKSWAHGGKQAFVVNPGECHVCKLCIEACPEDALKLAPLRV
jgi:4Fe-4S ferredoxin